MVRPVKHNAHRAGAVPFCDGIRLGAILRPRYMRVQPLQRKPPARRQLEEKLRDRGLIPLLGMPVVRADDRQPARKHIRCETCRPGCPVSPMITTLPYFAASPSAAAKTMALPVESMTTSAACRRHFEHLFALSIGSEIVSVAPPAFASCIRSGTVSTIRIDATPEARAQRSDICPIGPAPITSTLSPSW